MNHTCERTNMAHKCEIFETVSLTLHRLNTYEYIVSQVIGIITENKIYMPNKEYISAFTCMYSKV